MGAGMKVIQSLALFVLGSLVMTMTRGAAWLVVGAACWVMGAGVFVLAWLVEFWAERARYYESKAGLAAATHDMDLDRLAALGLIQHETRERVRVDVHQGTATRHFDLPVSLVKLRVVAQRLADGQPFTSRALADVLTDGEIRALRGAMRTRQLIEPVSDKDTRQGFTLTEAGRAVMASLLPSPTEAEGA